ncbi:hypothetical protein [Polluticoccus soli]|uniref:hypothetical protein n=1 Tax=Polluticoccus soli TaxID=3034150 RepID=UPI0023E1BEE2|nr:hypothetical protein [Flavipsychrobacter sp. JY13-12]
MFKNKSKLVFALSLAAFSGIATVSLAKPNIGAGSNSGNGQKLGQLKTTASCRPATAAIDLDINNVRARLMTGGDMWWDNGTSEARYEVPKGSRKNSLFAGSVWIGGYDAQGQLKVAAQTYRQSGNDYWPGPLDDAANIDAATCNEWDRFWKINKEDINRFRELKNQADALNEPAYEAIKQWPATGNINAVGKNLNPLNIGDDKSYAPFVDVDGDKKYRPDLGDYPNIQGDQYIWWVFNDKGNVKGESNTEGIGLEVQANAFAYSTKDFINDATFYNYKLINRGNLTLDSTYIATWTDADLGYHLDDFIGCDVSRGLGILYNAASTDGTGAANHYGEQVPMVGVDFFKGPKKFVGKDKNGLDSFVELKMEAFTYYNNDNSVIGNPRNGTHIYYYMTGSITNGQHFSNDFVGPNVPSKGYGTSNLTNFVFPGDPSDKTAWSECNCSNAPGDRRFVHSSGPFTLEPGVVNDITIGAIWVSDVGGCPNVSFRKIRAADDLAQSLYNNNFQRVEGPEAPRMVAREMDKKIVFYLVNDPISNNYGEKFGYDTAKKFRANATTSKSVKVADSLYKFEGYRVFQLRDERVQAAQIFDEDGELNTELAAEVFQTDMANGVSRIINYKKRTDLSDSTWEPHVMVTGKDSGVRHSFVITQDQFAKGNDKRLVNYRNYYFVAIAYAHNEFAPFNINDIDSSQEAPYIESSKGAGGSVIPVVVAMPNPANGDMGTVLNADYGDGVKITRIEGSGNGGNLMEMTEESENAALQTPFVVANPVYKQGNSPVNVKVIDPVRIKAHDWELFIEGGLQAGDRGLRFDSRWRLVNLTNGATIYGEQDLNNYNEQILEDYGLSVAVQQVVRPGDDEINGNGYITSSITFMDPAKPWLAGTQDAEGRDRKNWIRSGGAKDTFSLCDYNDRKFDTVGQFYESMMSNSTLTRGTWAPYVLGATGEHLTTGEVTTNCGFGVTKQGTFSQGLFNLQSVDVVFTSDKTKWTRCVVIEQQEDKSLAEGKAEKFSVRRHRSWTGELDASGRPLYSADASDTGMSYFPGYAVNQETGERLNIVFGEDSWLKNYNGNDMIWNPVSESVVTEEATGVSTYIFGGKHYIYVLNSRYDEGKQFKEQAHNAASRNNAYRRAIWVGNPLLAAGQNYLPLSEGFIPTETRVKIRVERPYANFKPEGVTLRDRPDPTQQGNPIYAFSTKDLAPKSINDNPDLDKQALLDRINVVPNPYYGYAGYEKNRLDTRVRIINLPKKSTVNIYSLEGALIRRLEKDNANAAYIDWDLRNSKGLPIASGMYLIHVQAEGIGETVLKWFGAMRPVDVTSY